MDGREKGENEEERKGGRKRDKNECLGGRLTFIVEVSQKDPE